MPGHSKNYKNLIFSFITIIIFLLFTELAFRLVLALNGFPFLMPKEVLFAREYGDSFKQIRGESITQHDDYQDILILGGSVVSPDWSGMEKRLKDSLSKRLKTDKIRIFNVAFPGHTSLDNDIKYRILHEKGYSFDLVLYYEAINENRANNISPVEFKPDYSHFKWYDQIYRIQKHPELNFTVIPYVFDYILSKVDNVIHKKTFLSIGDVRDKTLLKYGSDIKTAKSYERNLSGIVSLSRQYHEPLLLMSYAYYLPPDYQLTGGQEDKKYYADCKYSCSINIWGKPENIRKGIEAHNLIIRKLVQQHPELYYLDIQKIIQGNQNYFCDICHFSEEGAQLYAKTLVDFLIEKKLVH